MKILRKEMKLKGMTIKKLSELMGITPANIHGWLAGRYRPVPKKVLMLKELGFSDTACLEPSKDVDV